MLASASINRILVGALMLGLAALAAVSAPKSAEAFNSGKKCGSFHESALRTVAYRKGAASCSGAVRVVKSFKTDIEEWNQHGDGNLVTTYWTKNGWKCNQGSGGGNCSKDGKGHLFY